MSSRRVSLIQTLPDEVLLMIFRNLRYVEMRRVARVCRRWRNLSLDPELVHCLDLRDTPLTAKQFDQLARAKGPGYVGHPQAVQIILIRGKGSTPPQLTPSSMKSFCRTFSKLTEFSAENFRLPRMRGPIPTLIPDHLDRLSLRGMASTLKWFYNYYINSPTKFVGLTHLDLSGSTSVSGEDVRHCFGDCHETLRCLNVTGCYRLDPIQPWARHLPELEELRASGVLARQHHPLPELAFLLVTLPKLKRLEFSFGGKRCSEEPPNLSVNDFAHPLLTYLDMSHWNMTDEEIAAVQKACPRLEEFLYS